MMGISAGFIVGGLAAVAAITLQILICIWTYRDAENKGMNALLWAVLVFLIPGFITLLIYLIVRTDNNKIVCSNCNTRVNSNIKFCSNCGMELRPADIEIDKQEEFKKGQKKLLIGIFTALGVNIICAVMTVVFFILGAINLAERAVDWGSNLDINDLYDDIADAFIDFDRALGEEDFNISYKDDRVIITNDDGEEIVHIDGASEKVNLNDFNIGFKDGRVIITNDNGEEIIHIDEDSEKVNLNDFNISFKDGRVIITNDDGEEIIHFDEDSSISNKELNESIKNAIKEASE
ncbi:MAG: zinc ribbon domain-containing protein [Lachnospiraceae bacterium]|nr:zinc ribbon domain-containing protein [Lachnospiraceae bacterium]